MSAIEQFLAHKAYNMRVLAVKATTNAGSGHVTSALSAADIVATVFFSAMHYDPQNPHNPNNDRFILSKGHAAPILYAAWKEAGVLSEQEVMQLRQFDSPLEGHPTVRFARSEAATGSLGQGLSIGVGMCLAAKMDARDYRVYVLLGDSEMAEGSVWEALELASHYRLNNLIAIIDVNRLGQAGQTMDGHDLARYERKCAAFGWNTITVDGHDVAALVKALDQARASTDKPTVIISKTFKGYGISIAQDKNGFHGKALTKEEAQQALQELAQRFSAAAQYQPETWKPHVPTMQANKETKQETKTMPAITLPAPAYEKGKEVATRVAYGQALAALGDAAQELVSLDGEVKNSTFAQLFEQKHPKRFIESFIAEQNMVGMAVGLGYRGKIPFVSTFACFFTRAFDQLRMAAIGQSTIKLSGSHAGVSIGSDGPSQMGLEDIAMMRTLPGSVVLYPCDAVSTWKVMEQMANYRGGMSYLRTTRAPTPVIYNNDASFEIGGCKVLKQSGTDAACIIAAGITVFEALKAYEALKKENIAVSVIDAYSIKPLAMQIQTVVEKSGKRVITVEDHYLEGGLGQAVAYELRNTAAHIECLAVTKLPRSGMPQELLAYEGIDAAAIIAAVKKVVR